MRLVVASILELAGLAATAFGAATLLPVPSEPLFIGLLLLGETPAWLLVLVASVANTAGSVVNWWLGRQLLCFRDRSWFPATPAQLARATRWYARFGRWSLLLSWAPVFGDALTVMAGVLREKLWVFVLLVAIAKTSRYVALAAITLGLF